MDLKLISYLELFLLFVCLVEVYSSQDSVYRFCQGGTAVFLFDERQPDSDSYYAQVQSVQRFVQRSLKSPGRVSLLTVDSRLPEQLTFSVIFDSIHVEELTQDMWHDRKTSKLSLSELKAEVFSFDTDINLVVAVDLFLFPGNFLYIFSKGPPVLFMEWVRPVDLKVYEIHTGLNKEVSKGSRAFEEALSGKLVLLALVIHDSPVDVYQNLKNDICGKMYFLDVTTLLLPYGLCNDKCFADINLNPNLHEMTIRFDAYFWKLKISLEETSAMNTSKLSSLDWGEARRSCSRDGLSLLTIRNEWEAKLFSKLIPSFIEDKMEIDNFLQMDDYRVFIGLFRNRENVGQRFMWGHHRNLLFSYWAPGEPREKSLRGCADWRFRLNTESFDNETEPRWYSTGCGDLRATPIACHREVPPKKYSYTRFSLESEPEEQDIVNLGSFGVLYYESNVYHRSRAVSLSKVIAMGLPLINNGKTHIHGLVSGQGLAVEHQEREDLYENLRPLFHVCGEVDDQLSPRNGVALSQVCDGVIDCPTGSDETLCGEIGYRLCTALEFSCASRQCVPREARCDLVKDCQDGTDELDCWLDCPHELCSDGTCLPRSWSLDGVEDCADGLDEQRSSSKDNNCAFLCNRTSCVQREMLNNSVVDCTGPEGPLDETLGALQSINCSQVNGNVIQNKWAPKCIMVRDRFGEIIGCRNFEHLLFCRDFICPKGYAKCPASYCIPVSYVNDGKQDCSEGEDELGADRHGSEIFTCSYWSGQAVPFSVLCDGKHDCAGGEDELECGYSCPPGFICLAGAISVFRYNTTMPLRDLSFIDHRTRYLDLSGATTPDFFSNYPAGNLGHLLTLKLANCSIDTISSDWSVAKVKRNSSRSYRTPSKISRKRDFRTVKTADLSMNKLLQIPQYSFLYLMINLEELNLSYNKQLTLVSRDSFFGLGHLQVLDMSFTGIKLLNKDVFEYIPRLKTLSLKVTGITAINCMFPPTMQYLDLENTDVSDFNPDIFSKVVSLKQLLSSTYKLCCPLVLGPRIASHMCTFPGDAISSCSQLVPEVRQRAALWTMTLITLTGNIFTLVYRAMWDRETLRKSYGLFVYNLCLSDMFMGVYLMIVATADVLFQGTFVLHDHGWRNSPICWTAGALATLSSITSTLFVFLITVDRFLAVRYPFGQMRFTGHPMVGAVLASWLFGGSVALLPLMPFARDWVIFSTSGMCLGLPLGREKLPGWPYSVVVFVGLNFTLFLLIGIGQFAIYKKMKDKNKATRKHMNKSAQFSQNQRVQEFAVAKQLSLVVMTNFLCWFPIITMGLLALSGRNLGHDAFVWSAVLILPFNSALNPFLYSLPALKKKWSDFKAKRSEKASAKGCTKTTQSGLSSSSKTWVSGKVLLRCSKALSALHKDLIHKREQGVFTAAELDTLHRKLQALGAVIHKCGGK